MPDPARPHRGLRAIAPLPKARGFAAPALSQSSSYVHPGPTRDTIRPHVSASPNPYAAGPRRVIAWDIHTAWAHRGHGREK